MIAASIHSVPNVHRAKGGPRSRACKLEAFMVVVVSDGGGSDSFKGKGRPIDRLSVPTDTGK